MDSQRVKWFKTPTYQPDRYELAPRAKARYRRRGQRCEDCGEGYPSTEVFWTTAYDWERLLCTQCAETRRINT